MSGAAVYAESSNDDGELLVREYLPLVKRVAFHLAARLPSSVLVDDLVQAGMIGLLEAGRNFNPSGGASFETWASIRIRGSMLDELRRMEWAPRPVQRKARQMASAIRTLQNRLGRAATDAEVAREMDLDIHQYHSLLQETVTCQLYEQSGDTGSADYGEDHGPLDDLQQQGFRQALAGAVGKLPEREKLVMSLYYDDELNLKEIGAVLGVGESRVCQIHAQALARLRAILGNWRESVGE